MNTANRAKVIKQNEEQLAHWYKVNTDSTLKISGSISLYQYIMMGDRRTVL